MAYTFDQDYYIASKIALMNSKGQVAANGQPYTASSLIAVMADHGMTPRTHYENHGRFEGLNPNPYFNESEYLASKLNQLHSLNFLDKSGKAFTLETLKEAIAAAGMTPAEHYEHHGSYETDAQGNYLNPSNAFDANAYFQAKLLQTRAGGYSVGGHTGNGITMQDLMTAMQNSGMSLLSHYVRYGADEANAGQAPMLQTVPAAQRMPNDPIREILGDTLPTNYNPATVAPGQVVTPHGPVKPGDVGGLADSGISPAVTHPSESSLVPGDSGYLAPPSNLVDTNANPLVPPSSSGTGKATDYWSQVNRGTGGATLYDSNGQQVGTLAAGSVTTDSNGNMVIPDVPVGTEPVLPPPLPPADTQGIAAASDGDGNIQISGSARNGGSSVVLDSVGLVALTGQSANPPAGTRLDTATILDASGVTAQGGLLTLDTSAVAFAHSIMGGAGSNLVKPGAGITRFDGGAGNDRLALQAGKSYVLQIVDSAGSNSINFDTGGNTLTLEGGSNFLGTINGGAGADTLTLASGASFNGTIAMGGGNNTLVFEVNSTINLGGPLTLGNGNDTVIIDTLLDIDPLSSKHIISLGGGDDILTFGPFAYMYNPPHIDGGAGSDTLAFTGSGYSATMVHSITGVEFLDFSTTGRHDLYLDTVDGLGNLAVSVDAGGRDVIVLWDLTTLTGSAAAVDAVGEYYYDSAAKTLTYFDGMPRTIVFNHAGYIEEHPFGGMGWQEGVQPVGISFAYANSTLAVTGAARLFNSSLTVHGDGAISATGFAGSLPSGTLNAGDAIDTSGVVYNGSSLVISTRYFSGAHSIKGGAGYNDIFPSYGLTEYIGTTGRDFINLDPTLSYRMKLVGGSNDDDGVHFSGTPAPGFATSLTLEAGTNFSNIHGCSGADAITLNAGAWIGAIWLGDGDDTLTVEAGAQVYHVYGGGGLNTFTIQGGLFDTDLSATLNTATTIVDFHFGDTLHSALSGAGAGLSSINVTTTASWDYTDFLAELEALFAGTDQSVRGLNYAGQIYLAVTNGVDGLDAGDQVIILGTTVNTGSLQVDLASGAITFA